MKITFDSGPLSGVIFCAFLAFSGTSFAATGNSQPASVSSTIGSTSFASPCANPVVMATGGLCCPLQQSPAESCSQKQKSVIEPAMARMKPLKVNGVMIPLVVVAQVVKKGLRRPWSPAMADRNLVVCRYGNYPNSRLPRLHCLSNKTHFRNPVTQHLSYDPTKSKISCYSGCFLTQGNVAVSMVRYVNSNARRAKLVSSLLNRVPESQANYTLRMPETVPMRFPSLHKVVDYPVFVTFSIANGDLSDIELSKRLPASETAP